MSRFLLGMLGLCLIVGCGRGHKKSYEGYDGLREFLPPTVVRLPYKASFGKADVSIDIQAIPGRTDAVQFNARLFGHDRMHYVEWTQEGCSVKQFPFCNGMERFDICFLEMHSSDDAVSEVKLSIVYRFNYGAY